MLLTLILFHLLQTICTPDQLGCIQKIKENIGKEDFNSCVPSCHGLLVSSFSKTEANRDEHDVGRRKMSEYFLKSFSQKFLSLLSEEYQEYKGSLKLPADLKG